MMDYKISIIIPIYNVELYVREALASIERQSIGLENIQVIMVNDCSSDESGNIINEYSEKYSNFISVHLAERSGAAGKPRNVGLQYALGKYVMFLDPDDYYEDDACELLFNKIENDQSDVAVGRFRYANSNILGNWLQGETKIVEDIDADPRILELPPSIWTKIFRKSFIEKYRIIFPEKIVAQDLVFFVHSCLSSKKISLINHIVCNYRVRDENNKSISNELSKVFFDGVNDAYKLTYDLCGRYKKTHLYKYIIVSTLEYIINKLAQAKELTNDELIVVLKNMQWYFDLALEFRIEPTENWQKFLLKKLSKGQYDQFIELKEAVYELRMYILEVEKGKTWLEQKMANEHHEVEVLQNYLKDLEEGRDWLEKQLNNRQIETEALQQHEKELRDEKNWLEQKNADLNNNLNLLQQQYNDLTKQCDDLTKQYDDLEKRFIEITSIRGWIKYQKNRNKIN